MGEDDDFALSGRARTRQSAYVPNEQRKGFCSAMARFLGRTNRITRANFLARKSGPQFGKQYVLQTGGVAAGLKRTSTAVDQSNTLTTKRQRKPPGNALRILPYPRPTADIVMACVMVADTFTAGSAVCFGKDLNDAMPVTLLSSHLVSPPPLFTYAIREPSDSKQPEPIMASQKSTPRGATRSAAHRATGRGRIPPLQG